MWPTHFELPLINKELCAEIINFSNNLQQQKSVVYNTKSKKDVINEAVRKSNTVKINDKSFRDKLFDIIEAKISELQINGFSFSLRRSNLEILKYIKGDYFAPHRDFDIYNSNIIKSYSLLVYLNDDYTGGNTMMDEHEIQYSTGKGLVFKNTILHSCKTITEGVKYVLKADIDCRIVPSQDESLIITFPEDNRFYVLNLACIGEDTLLYSNYRFNIASGVPNPNVILLEDITYEDFESVYKFLNNNILTNECLKTLDYLNICPNNLINAYTSDYRVSPNVLRDLISVTNKTADCVIIPDITFFEVTRKYLQSINSSVKPFCLVNGDFFVGDFPIPQLNHFERTNIIEALEKGQCVNKYVLLINELSSMNDNIVSINSINEYFKEAFCGVNPLIVYDEENYPNNNSSLDNDIKSLFISGKFNDNSRSSISKKIALILRNKYKNEKVNLDEVMHLNDTDKKIFLNNPKYKSLVLEKINGAKSAIETVSVVEEEWCNDYYDYVTVNINVYCGFINI